MTHYVPKLIGGGWYGFTTPLGRHESHWTEEMCQKVIDKIRERHLERAQGEGHEAALLLDYFDHEGQEAIEPDEPKKAMEAFPCTGKQVKHDWAYNETTGFWHCSACDTDKRDFDKALRDRRIHMSRKNREDFRKSC